MKRLSLIAAVAGSIACAAYVTTLSATAQSPTPIPSVWLQAGSPGTLQAGNFNISGKGKATQIEAIYGGPLAALWGQATQTTGAPFGVLAISAGVSGAGVYSTATSATGIATGVSGISQSVSGHGVWGQAQANSGTNYGVRGNTNSFNGYGVYGSGPGVAMFGTGPYIGVYGVSTGAFGTGLQGWSQGNDSTGVLAQADGANSVGVYSLGSTAGVFGGFYTGVSAWSSNTSGQGSGVYSTSSSPDGFAISARNMSASGTAIGIRATSDSPTGTSIRAEAYSLFGGTPLAIDATSNNYYAIRATSTNSHGIFSETTGGGGIVGVWGQGVTPGATGLAGRGITGVYGVTTTPGGNAGHFDGNLYAVSSSATVKAFVIDHPLDPENKLLYHSCVESNERITTYKGRAVLDANGEAWVQLPDYFEALNGDIEYQLTAIGKPNPNIYIANEVKNNRFAIAGGVPGSTVSWQVFGVRHDSYAVAHPLQTEVEKPDYDKGRYLTPVEHGQPEERGLTYDVAMRSAAMLADKEKRSVQSPPGPKPKLPARSKRR